MSAEIGSAHVSIFPTMTGFRSKVNAEMNSSASSAASIFKRIFSKNGTESGEGFGRGVKQALDKAVKGVKFPALDMARQQLAKFTAEASSESAKNQASTLKAEAAQEKYNQAVAKYGENSAQAKTAQAALVTAQQRSEAGAEKYAATQDKLKAAQDAVNASEKQYAPAKYTAAQEQVKALTAAKKAQQSVYEKASKAEQKAEEALSKAINKHGVESAQAQKAQDKLTAVLRQSRPVAENLKKVEDQLAKAQDDLSKASKDYKPPKLSGFQQAISRVKESIHSLSGTTSSVREKISAGTVALGQMISTAITSSVSHIKDFAQECMEAYNEASSGVAKFNQIASNNHWSEEQKNSLDELSESLMHVGVIDDDVARAGQAQLGTFKLSAQAVKTLTPALEDMVAHTKGLNATEQDSVDIGNLMGKVMTGSTSALTRYGVTMDDSQKKLLKQGSAEQRAATLAKILEQNFGGVNKALAKTPAGKMKQLQNNVEDLKKNLGASFTQVVGSIAPLITKGLEHAKEPVERFANWFTTAVSGISKGLKTGQISKDLEKAFGVNAQPILEGIKGIRQGFSDAIKGIGSAFGSISSSASDAKKNVNPLASAFKLLGDAAKTVGGVIKALGPHFKTIATVILTVVGAFKTYQTTVNAVNAVQRILNATMRANLFGIIVTAIAAVVAGLIVLEKKFHIFEKAGAAIQKAWKAVSGFFKGLFGNIGKWAQGVGKNIGKHFDDAKKGAQKAWDGAGKWFKKTGDNIAKGFKGAGKDIQKHFNDAKKGSQSAWKNMNKWAKDTSKKIGDGFNSLKDKIKNHFSKSQKVATEVWKHTPKWFKDSVAGKIVGAFVDFPSKMQKFFNDPIGTIKGIWNGLKSWFSSIPGAIGDFFRSLPGKIHDFFKSAGDKVRDVWNGVTDWFKSIPGRIAGFFGDLPGKMLEVGKNIIDGIKRGIENSIGSVAQAITGGMKSAVDHVKSFLGIHSPSTVMRDEVGKFIGLGMAEGIRGSMPAVSDAMGELVKVPRLTASDVPEVPVNARVSNIQATGLSREDVKTLVTAIEDLHRDLPEIIQRFTPAIGRREFNRMGVEAMRSVMSR